MNTKNNPSWHYLVKSIILVVKSDVASMLTALHKVNLEFYSYFLSLNGSWNLLVSSTMTIALSSLLSTDHLKITIVGRIKSLMSHQILFTNYSKFKLLLHSLYPILSVKSLWKIYQHLKWSRSRLRELGTYLQRNL